MMLNRYPNWKYAVLLFVFVLGVIYSAPNLYGEDPAIQVLPAAGGTLEQDVPEKIRTALERADLPVRAIQHKDNAYLIRFPDTTTQMKAQEVISHTLGEHYIIALNLAPKTPHWLEILGAKPMKLGLDLRGGVHFLIAVETDVAIERRVESLIADLRQELRRQNLRYRGISATTLGGLALSFDDPDVAASTLRYLQKEYHEIDCQQSDLSNELSCVLKPNIIQDARHYTIEQTMTTLRNRVNELGVSEAVVQRQGANHIVVELPGIQDTARAKDILGKTATLEFHLYAREEAPNVDTGAPAPPGTKWYYNKDGKGYLLKKRVILTGESITGASVGTDDRTGRPAVHVRVGGVGLALFKKETLANIGNEMGVVYLETRTQESTSYGRTVKTQRNIERLISIATIQSALGSQFQITGLGLVQAQDLALLLRAGALPATINIVEERTIGPSLGQENVHQGMLSIVIGMALVVVAMLLYYSFFGLIANFALAINVVLLIALLSLIGATLTLPGMAGIVLTVGMAVDANVLIFERIREELRNGMSAQAAIHSGFERALSTIVDANLTTLIVGIILFCVGTGPVKGFAITLCLGIMTSMLTAITMTRAMVNFAYGGRSVKHLRIGM